MGGGILASHPVVSSAVQKQNVLLLDLDSASPIPAKHDSQLPAGGSTAGGEGAGSPL